MKKILIFYLSVCLILVSCDTKEEDLSIKKDYINVDVAFTIEKINPLSSNIETSRFLSNVFSSLVRFNNIMRIEPDLAISWGNIDDYTWEFKIRDNIYFHDGTKMNMDDIVSTLNFVKDNNFLNTNIYLQTVDKITYNGNILKIKTKIKDPLLLQKLTHVFIIKKDNLKNKDVRIGSSKYKIEHLDDKNLIFVYFNKYYGSIPYYKKVVINFVEDKHKRFQNITNSGVDILVDVPLDFISDIEEKDDLEIFEISSLDTIFLVFNLKDTGQNFLINKEFRKLLCDTINKDTIVEIAGNRYTNSINQFLNSNVFGFDPNLEKIKQLDISVDEFKTKAKEIFGKELNIPLSIYTTKTMSVIAENIQQQLFKYGINIDVKVLDEKEFLNSIKDGIGNIYLIGWRFDLLDPFEFFDTILKYSNINLINSELVNDLNNIKDVMNVDKRIVLIKSFSQKIIMDEYIGVPLIETKNIYVKLKYIKWQPRVDGSVVFN